MTARYPAVVTGATGGIGRACAAELAGRGHPVAICGRRTHAAEALARDLRQRGGEAAAYPLDVRSEDQVRDMFEAVRDRYGDPAILVTCAVESRIGPFLDLTDDDWLVHYESKVLGTLRCLRAAIPAMVRLQWGRIVTMAGTTARSRGVGRATNGMTNAAIANISAHVAEEFANAGVLINTIHPGFTETPRLEMIVERFASRDNITTAAARQKLQQSIPSGHFVNPNEIAALVGFLCSDANLSITGQAIAVDGGMASSISY